MLSLHNWIFNSPYVIKRQFTKIYKQVIVHIGLQIHKRKFMSSKYTRRYSYAKFGTFLAPPRSLCAGYM